MTSEASPHRGDESRVWKDDGGSGLIELAVVLPVFFLVTFGFINFMMVAFGLENITTATRSAARYGCLHSSTSMAPAMASDFTNIVSPYIFQYPANTWAVSTAYSGGTPNTVGTNIYVLATVTYKIVLPGYTYNALTISANSACYVTQ